MLKNKHINIFIIITFVLILGLIYHVYSNSKDDIDMQSSIGYGNPNAKIKMVEYMSFQCIDCFNLHENIGKTLKNKIKDGEVYYVLKHVDFEKFKYDDIIFNSIENIENIETIDYVMRNYNIWSKMKSIEEVKQFLKLKNIKKERIEMQRNIKKEQKKYKIEFIPTFYLNGKKFVGVFTDKEFKQMINDTK